MRALVAFLVLALGVSGGLAAARADCALEAGERVRIAGAIDGDTVSLAGGGEVRLVGIQAPKLALGRAGFSEWPLAGAAARALSQLADGRAAVLKFGGAREDRHRRILAHVFVITDEGPVWAQGRMLERGLARVYSFADNRACVAEMLERERAARAGNLGIWAEPHYAVRDAGTEEALESLEGTFQLVEGRVEDVAIVGERVYLNFGQDYRHDFTISIDPRDARRFAERGKVLRDVKSRRVRVRGWIAVINGPMIEATHPEQIEILDGPREAR